MKGGILNSLLKPFINAINATQPACHGDVIPRNLFSTTGTHERTFVANEKSDVQDSNKGTPSKAPTSCDEVQLASQDDNCVIAAMPFDTEMNTDESGIPADQQQDEKNTIQSNNLNTDLPKQDTDNTPGASKKRRPRRKNEVSGKDVLKNWDQPLLMRLRTNRAAGYDNNGHAINHPRFKRVKTNGRSHYEKVQDETQRTTAISKRRKPQ
ncbi:MAG: hypothetical protein BGO43_13250 [Gammaproteobacteria bacterium 39-13]|nr:hypothetical protein [Gammaproteobacteria bacterium]OJV95911.1 MAG: hypothetical protein BGO43_13250 [Gammaproteobacteria bacterium 39-13]